MNLNGWRDINSWGVFANASIEEYPVPVITINGSSSITIKQNSIYVDAGATADDGEGNDQTNNIVTTNLVNSAAVGIYTVTYFYQNIYGESDTKTRTVTVEAVIFREMIGASSLITIIDGYGVLNG